MPEDNGHETELPSPVQIAEFHAAVLTKLPRKLSRAQMGYWLAHKKQMLRALSGLTCYPVDVDYRGEPRLYMSGLFGHFCACITCDGWPVHGSGESQVGLELFRFGYNIRYKEVLVHLEAAGFRQADVMELIAFARTYPAEQMKYPIAALGSVWSDTRHDEGWPEDEELEPDDREYVAVLTKSKGCQSDELTRTMTVHCIDEQFTPGYRFLVVRK